MRGFVLESLKGPPRRAFSLMRPAWAMTVREGVCEYPLFDKKLLTKKVLTRALSGFIFKTQFDSKRMLIHIKGAKGRKDRYTVRRPRYIPM
ncbi:MAG: hypothetical protein HY998_01590 [candidate division NC10 bacterium]|nr:hypothetical protein [candidate division NC10 bacterium]